MVKLTENMVLTRTRTQDLENVRKLNCWGSELTDVSVVRLMPNIQVISLSVNRVASLEDFAYCPSLEELYIRKNEISTLGEICYLKRLKKLRVLWLMDNPCAECDHYRLTVLRNLPHLQKLDNIMVTRDELAEATRVGKELFSTSDCPAPLCRTHNTRTDNQSYNHSTSDLSNAIIESSRPASSWDHDQQAKQSVRISHEAIPTRSLHGPNDPLPSARFNEANVDNLFDNDEQSWNSKSVGGVDNFGDPVQPPTSPRANTHQSKFTGTRQFSVQKIAQLIKPARSKPKSNANVLQAVLCLVNELDQDSLEVLGDAIRNRLQREEY